MTDFIKLQGIFEEGYGIIAKKVMRDKALNVIAKSIYSYICSYSGKGNDAFPSQKLICSDLDISKDTLVKYTNQLKERGYITVKQEKEKGKFARNVYTINIVPCMVSSDTVKTDTVSVGYGEVDTNNNTSLNNNNNINNNNNKDVVVHKLTSEQKKFNEDFKMYEMELSMLIRSVVDMDTTPKRLFQQGNGDFKYIKNKFQEFKGQPAGTIIAAIKNNWNNKKEVEKEKNKDNLLKGLV